MGFNSGFKGLKTLLSKAGDGTLSVAWLWDSVFVRLVTLDYDCVQRLVSVSHASHQRDTTADPVNFQESWKKKSSFSKIWWSFGFHQNEKSPDYLGNY